MTLLLPLGLLALLSVAVLLLIYIIRPNYQQKYISSTYVWKLSLKLKRKRVPISKLRNLLLILCQILFLAACGLAIAQPALVTRAIVSEPEVIAVIDSSASMRAGIDDETRFERAVYGAMDLAAETFAASGYVTVIVAGDAPEVLEQRITSERREILNEKLEELLEADSCSYGTADIDAAMEECERIIYDNPNAKIYLFTDTEYTVETAVNIVDVKAEGEWNAGILDAYAVLEDGWYSLYVEVACYGKNEDLSLTVDINDAYTYGGNGVPMQLSLALDSPVYCSNDETVTVIFRNGNSDDEDLENTDNVHIVYIDSASQFYAFGEILISIPSQDAFPIDNTFSIYGGTKPVVDVLYASSDPNVFMSAVLESISTYYKSDKPVWDIRITEMNSSTSSVPMPTSGYDFYIYEHVMPSKMPEDGIVILWNPDTAPEGSGLSLGGVSDYTSSMGGSQGIYLTNEYEGHPLLNNISPEKITVSRFRNVVSYDGSYDVLMSCDNDPVLLAKNEGASKVVVAMFSLHYSSLAIDSGFPTLFYNIFETYMPATVDGNAFSVYETVSLNSRGSSLTVSGPGISEDEGTFSTFPAQLELNFPGRYTITQMTDFNDFVVEHIYVKIPEYESNIVCVEDAFVNPYLAESNNDYYDDLILYVASAFVALLFIEWLLQYRANV